MGGFDESFVACQDYDTWTRLIKKYGCAKRISGTSYIIHRGDNIDRITEPTNWLKGHEQFLKKYGFMMTEKNNVNQSFRKLVAKKEKLELSKLYYQISAGLIEQKLRYFLSSNFSFFARLRKFLLEK